MTEKPYIDLVVVIPMESEFHQFKKAFSVISDITNDGYLQEMIDTGVDGISALLIVQHKADRGRADQAAEYVFERYDVGVIISLGIAGGLSSDLKLGDVCYTGNIIDVYNNQKISGKDTIDIKFSPEYYATPQELESSISFVRMRSSTRAMYESWQGDSLLQAGITLAEKKNELEMVGEFRAGPNSHPGFIMCAAVTDSDAYNALLKRINRKVLAVDTESGAIFDRAQRNNTPALTIRSISDHANSDKNALEERTGDAVREVAAFNAAAFLRLQLQNESFTSYVKKRRLSFLGAEVQPKHGAAEAELPAVIGRIEAELDQRLRELSVQYRMQSRGYKLPTPRIKKKPSAGTSPSTREFEIFDALIEGRIIAVDIPTNYPDNALPWILAKELNGSQVGDRQLIPVVVHGEGVRPPRHTLASSMTEEVEAIASDPAAQIVFIVDELPKSSKTGMNFLLDQIKRRPNDKFVITTRFSTHPTIVSEFCQQAAADSYDLKPISFSEITKFVEANYGIEAAEAEVIAYRLRDTFDRFKLFTHPTYFAGISKETIYTLLNVNKRAELIQLAVDGLLSIVVATDDNRDISRTTRARFLRSLAIKIRIEKHNFDHNSLVSLAAEESRKFDLGLDPVAFIRKFSDHGLLHYESEYAAFSQPFVEQYLAAVALLEEPEMAKRYFEPSIVDFDIATFDLYCEMGGALAVKAQIIEQLKAARDKLPPVEGVHILLSDKLKPAFLSDLKSLRPMQQRLSRASEDVRNNVGGRDEKQSLLDLFATLRSESAAIGSDADNRAKIDEILDIGSDFSEALGLWLVAVTMLGASAENMEAEEKRRLIDLILSTASALTHIWTSANSLIDFSEMRSKMMSSEFREHIEESIPELSKMKNVDEFISYVVDVREFMALSEPLSAMFQCLCEQSGQRVLSTTLGKISPSDPIEALLHSVWLADVDTKVGAAILSKVSKGLPKRPLLRYTVAGSLLSRVIWAKWKKDDRLKLLDIAEQTISPFNGAFDKASLKRLIDESTEANDTRPVAGP